MKRYYHIDLLRFIASIMVILHHYCFRGGYNGDYLKFDYEEFHCLYSISKYGFLGVEFFFVLSGFVIAQSLFKSDSVKIFLIKRIRRIYPTYFICCCISFIVIFCCQPFWGKLNIKDLFANLIFINFPLRLKNVDDVYWTLHLELLFYAWSCIVLCFSKNRHIGMLLFFITSLAVYDVKYISQIFMSQYILFFFLGYSIFSFKQKSSLRTFLVLSFSMILSLFSIIDQMNFVASIYNIPFESSVGVLVVLSVSFFLLVDIEIKSMRVQKLFYYLGVISYPIYLLHQNIGYIILGFLKHYANEKIILLLTILIVLLLSYTVCFLLEPIMVSYLNRKKYLRLCNEKKS